MSPICKALDTTWNMRECWIQYMRSKFFQASEFKLMLCNSQAQLGIWLLKSWMSQRWSSIKIYIHDRRIQVAFFYIELMPLYPLKTCNWCYFFWVNIFSLFITFGIGLCWMFNHKNQVPYMQMFTALIECWVHLFICISFGKSIQ